MSTSTCCSRTKYLFLQFTTKYQLSFKTIKYYLFLPNIQLFNLYIKHDIFKCFDIRPIEHIYFTLRVKFSLSTHFDNYALKKLNKKKKELVQNMKNMTKKMV